MRAICASLLLLPSMMLACGGDGDPGAAAGLPCDVDAVLAQNCRMCHAATPLYGAPMPLVTLADLQAPAVSDGSKKVYELVAQRIHNDQSPMPPPPNERLSDAEAAVLDDWIASGTQAGSGSCGAGGGGGGGTTLGCTPDVTLQPATPWTMPKDTQDAYVCYGVDVQLDAKRHLIGMAPFIDNSTIVHHILLFQADAPYDPTPALCGGGDKGRLVGVWAPGGQALELPPEAGFPLEGTAHFVLQIHYSNLMALDGQEDRSGYNLCTITDLRPNDADIVAFGTAQINIPAHGSLDVTCDFDLGPNVGAFTAFAGMPHMHKIGKYISSNLLPGGSGAPVNLGTADPWDFQSQAWTTLETTVKGGDKVRTRCAWDNPGASNVTFGEETQDEMCFSFVMFYPRIVTAGWNWSLPALFSTCTPTP